MADMKINYGTLTEFLKLGFVLREYPFRIGEKAKRIIKIFSFEIKRKSTVIDVISINIDKNAVNR